MKLPVKQTKISFSKMENRKVKQVLSGVVPTGGEGHKESL
jgi:hypothetical protein